MEQHFQNKIEEGLFKIEKNKKMMLTENKKKMMNIDSDNHLLTQSDTFSIEGCCYELAVFLLKNRTKKE